MARLLVKNIGPIKDVDIELKKVNVFMGPQGCGKSTLAKIISFCSWLEKDNERILDYKEKLHVNLISSNVIEREMQAYMTGIPYVEEFKKKLENVAVAEGFYEYTMYLFFSMLNVYVRTQVKCAKGRADLVVWMPDAIYVFEMKVNGTAQDALAQINEKDYAIPYKTDGRRVVKVGVKFDVNTRFPESWVIEKGYKDSFN